MAKFGLFEDGKPLRSYEGDCAETYVAENLVKILKKAQTREDSEIEVATIKLKPGQSIEKID